MTGIDMEKAKPLLDKTMATADDLQRVADACTTCQSIDELSETLGLQRDVIDACLDILHQLGIVTSIGEKHCLYRAAVLQQKLRKACEICGEKKEPPNNDGQKASESDKT